MPSGLQSAHLAIADKQQTAFVEPRLDTVNDRHVQAIIGSFTRQNIRRQGHPHEVQRPDHDFDLGPARVVFAMAKLKQSAINHLVITRDCGGITADHLLSEVVHFNAALIQVLLDLVPIRRLAQVFQEMAQPVVTKI
jgi:hypothetical protein